MRGRGKGVHRGGARAAPRRWRVWGEEIADFVEYASPDGGASFTVHGDASAGSVAKSLWPGSEAEPFSSTKHRMLLHRSDLDVPRIRTVGKFENIPSATGSTSSAQR